MHEHHALEEQNRSRAAHELWLAMQAAYERYKEASVLLDSITTSSEIDTSVGNPELARMAATQRAAFENYVEARLHLSEFLVSDQNAKQQKILVPESSRGVALDSRNLLLATVVALVFLLAFEMRTLAEARGHNRELERGLTTANAALNQKQDQIGALAHQLEKLGAANATLARSIGRSQGDRTRVARTTGQQFAAPGRNIVKKPQPFQNRWEAREHLRADLDRPNRNHPTL